jgi:hypothetical protein
MLDNTNLEERPLPAARGLSGLDELVAGLEAHRVTPRLVECDSGMSAGGVALRISVQKALQAPMASEHLMRRVTTLSHQNVPLTLSLCELGAEDEAIRALEDICGLLRQALSSEGLGSARVGLSMQSHLVPLQAYLLVSTAILGRRPRYVMLDALQMRHHGSDVVQEEAGRNWSFLWNRREASPTLVPAYAASVTTRCPLLGDEAATCIVPEAGLQAPVETAWLPMEVDLADFTDGNGRVQWEALQPALEQAVDIGDRIYDHLHWPLPQQRSDAWQNRRLAISVSGIGDLALERGADPADLRCLQWIDGTIARIHALLWNRSRALAQRTEPLPALLCEAPAVRWDCDIKKSDWDLRWRRAVASSAVRHRNLLVMSPYSVLPDSVLPARESAAGFADLLPVLHHADAFSFACPRVQGFRNCDEFANFHRRAWAVMQRRNAASLVAAGV